MAFSAVILGRSDAGLVVIGEALPDRKAARSAFAAIVEAGGVVGEKQFAEIELLTSELGRAKRRTFAVGEPEPAVESEPEEDDEDDEDDEVPGEEPAAKAAKKK